MNKPYKTLLMAVALLLSACATGPSIEELNPKVRGMSRAQLLGCMGPPNSTAKDGNIEFLTYSYRSVYDKYSYQCDSHFVLTDGRVSKLNVTGDPPGTIDVTSGVCRSLVAKCVQ